jgi:hypothetical protein
VYLVGLFSTYLVALINLWVLLKAVDSFDKISDYLTSKEGLYYVELSYV